MKEGAIPEPMVVKDTNEEPTVFSEAVPIPCTAHVPSAAFRSNLLNHFVSITETLSAVPAEPIPLITHRKRAHWRAMAGLTAAKPVPPTPQLLSGVRHTILVAGLSHITEALEEHAKAANSPARVTLDWVFALLTLLSTPLDVDGQATLHRAMRVVAWMQAKHTGDAETLALMTAILVVIADVYGQKDEHLFRQK